MAKALMVVGTASNVGKSVIVTALCRIFSQAGIKTAPFKSQNMSLNAAVTPLGKEIGRAQAVQARAAGIEPNEHMNPVLLKPTGVGQSQVILQGVPIGNMQARQYYTEQKQELWEAIKESYAALAKEYDLIVIEGAGSPVEMNLKANDLANMRVARMADAHVLLVADIDRGGAFAAVVGTLQLLDPDERALVKGIIINRFRGDLQLFVEGRRWLEKHTGLPVLGVIPYLNHLHIAEEDSLALTEERLPQHRHEDHQATIRIGIIQYPHISNFTDFDPLWQETGVEVKWIKYPFDIEGLDVLILPGSKSTLQDLGWLQARRFTTALLHHVKRGGFLFGICGGYQMMGQLVKDPWTVESKLTEVTGLGIFPLTTAITKDKQTQWTSAKLAGPYEGLTVSGYELHMGVTEPLSKEHLAFAKVPDQEEREEGTISADGRSIGTYLHHIFHNDAFRLKWLNDIRLVKGLTPLEATNAFLAYEDEQIDLLANTVKDHLNLERLCTWLDCQSHSDDVP